MSAHDGALDAEAELSVFDEVVAERDAARADAYEKVQALAAVSGILLGIDVPSTWDHYGAVADARKCVRERDEARALNHRGLMKLVENERLRMALEEIAGMCNENAEQMQVIAQDALGSMPPSNLPYVCPKSVAVAEDLTPGEVRNVETKENES